MDGCSLPCRDLAFSSKAEVVAHRQFAQIYHIQLASYSLPLHSIVFVFALLVDFLLQHYGATSGSAYVLQHFSVYVVRTPTFLEMIPW